MHLPVSALVMVKTGKNTMPLGVRAAVTMGRELTRREAAGA